MEHHINVYVCNGPSVVEFMVLNEANNVEGVINGGVNAHNGLPPCLSSPMKRFRRQMQGKNCCKVPAWKVLTRLRDRAHMHLSRVRRSWCHCTYCLSYCRLLSVKHDIVFCHLQVIIILLTLPIDIRDRRSKQEYLCLHFLGLTLPPLSQYEPQNQR